MIELVKVQQFQMGRAWTHEDWAILEKQIALCMVAHDLRDYLSMSAEVAMGDFAGRLVSAAKEQS